MTWQTAVGRSHQYRRTFHQADVRAHNELVSDTAPLDQVPEALIAGMVSTILGIHLPGRGTNYLKQYWAFTHPAPVEVELVAQVTIARVVPAKGLVYLDTICTRAEGPTIASGTALVLAPWRKEPSA